MKFDKKVMESGIVAAFTLVVTMSSVCGTNVTTQAPNSQEVELSAEPIKVSDGAMKATKERLERTVVAASIAENDPEQEAKEVQDVPEEEKKAESEDSSEKAVEEVVAEKETAEEASETTEDEEAKEAESSEDVKETAEEASETKEVEVSEGEAEEKEEIPETEAASEEKTVRDGLLEVGSEEISPWASKLLPNVEDYLNVRTEASDEAELAGKLHKGASADILERGDEWTKIKSGNVEGYVKNEFCVTGLEAEDLANQVGTTYATATTGGVRVRENASSSEDTEILDVLEEGGQVKVDTQTEASEGWVAVKTEEGTGYVSAEYVNVELKLGKAISIEEERAAIAAAEAEKARKARQAAASAGTSQRGAVAASYDDVTLLGALIQCEAGSEPYEGQLAVGAVVMNRLRAGYAGSISGVIYQSGQFSPASSGKLASVLANGVSGSCMQAAQAAIGGASNVGGATSFRSASSGTPGIVIGNHVFF
ncbi:MAG: SH3 domain-containing protein [Lachnospiraceae bacterium]|nr:SH3 domain-containing protein [Lachnospiraceae bacterium]